jgi:hypothetical protein
LNKEKALKLLLNNDIENIFNKDNIYQYRLKFLSNNERELKNVLSHHILEFTITDREIIEKYIYIISAHIKHNFSKFPLGDPILKHFRKSLMSGADFLIHLMQH